jgi:hypothetical protein
MFPPEEPGCREQGLTLFEHLLCADPGLVYPQVTGDGVSAQVLKLGRAEQRLRGTA